MRYSFTNNDLGVKTINAVNTIKRSQTICEKKMRKNLYFKKRRKCFELEATIMKKIKEINSIIHHYIFACNKIYKKSQKLQISEKKYKSIKRAFKKICLIFEEHCNFYDQIRHNFPKIDKEIKTNYQNLTLNMIEEKISIIPENHMIINNLSFSLEALKKENEKLITFVQEVEEIKRKLELKVDKIKQGNIILDEVSMNLNNFQIETVPDCVSIYNLIQGIKPNIDISYEMISEYKVNFPSKTKEQDTFSQDSRSKYQKMEKSNQSKEENKDDSNENSASDYQTAQLIYLEENKRNFQQKEGHNKNNKIISKERISNAIPPELLEQINNEAKEQKDAHSSLDRRNFPENKAKKVTSYQTSDNIIDLDGKGNNLKLFKNVLQEKDCRSENDWAKKVEYCYKKKNFKIGNPLETGKKNSEQNDIIKEITPCYETKK